VITIFSNRIKNDQTITINGDGYQSRDFVYVGDIVSALSVAMKYCHHYDPCEIFNVSTGIDTTIIDLAKEIGVILSRTPDTRYGAPRRGDPRRSIGCTEKVHRILGFRAMTNLTVGLKKTLREGVPAYGEV